MSIGILSYGAHLPRLRLPRRAIAEANRWFNASPAAKGERTMCNWDEDPVTMAVEAARDALAGRDRSKLRSLCCASTTLPFLDRLNAGIVAEAMGLPEQVATQDVTATQRAGTSALRSALRGGEETLVVATEQRRARAASPLEMTSGDGAAAILVGEGEPVARLLADATRHADFVDHYRTPESGFDHQWEERWIRDAGYLTLVPPVIRRCLDVASVRPADVAHFCLPAALPRLAGTVAKAAGIPDAAVRDSLHSVCGDTGAAHPLVMLISALERATPGDRILLVGFGQGVDALLFEVTAASRPGCLGVQGCLARRREETSYAKFLAFNGILEIDRGMRADTDKLTPLSALWRNRRTVTAFTGGRCSRCGTPQFPSSRICVSPECNAVDTQEPCCFADTPGRILSYTADRLTYSPDPPAWYGMIEFEGGGRWLMDFADVDADRLEVGQAVSMKFRIKEVDTQRGFRRYFWKAAPLPAR